jgi:hypothetical protein
MRGFSFKPDGYTPIVTNDKNLASEDQVKKAQSYVDQIASQKTHVTPGDWFSLYFFRHTSEKKYLEFTVCFEQIGPYLPEQYNDDVFYHGVLREDLDLQTREVKKWIQNADDISISIDPMSEYYCVDFKFKN